MVAIYRIFTISIVCISNSVFAKSTLIKNVTLISGVPNSEVVHNVDVFFDNGIIQRIDKAIDVPANATIDGSGKTLLPGLIDSHTHLLSVPGAYFRKDSTETIEEQQKLQLSAYLNAGFTTVLDAAAPPEVFTKWESINSKPRIYGLSPFLTPSGGYFGSSALRTKTYENLAPAVKGMPGEIQSVLSAPQPKESIGVKVTVEDGFGPVAVWPLFDEASLKEIAKEAAVRNLRIFVHAMSEKEFERGLKLNPYAFVHGGFADENPSDEFLQKLKNSGAYVVSTLAIYDLTLLLWQKSRFEEPHLIRLVPKLQIETAKNQEMTDRLISRMASTNTPSWFPNFLAEATASWFFNEDVAAKLLGSCMRAIKKMSDAGIPIVMGSDAGNWPLWTTYFHGYASTRELELLEQAGLAKEEIIIASTYRAAKMIGKLDSIGSVEVGKAADLVLLSSNPLEAGMKAFRDIELVLKGGEIVAP